MKKKEVRKSGSTYGTGTAVVRLLHLIQDHVLHKDRDCLQDEGQEQVDVDVVSCAVKFPTYRNCSIYF